MRYQDSLYEAFLEEMHRLEEFRLNYSAEHPDVPLERDDPDVKRLVEALAFFSARSHSAGIRNITNAQRRMFRQFFPYILSPLPSMAIVQAQPLGELADRVNIPASTELLIVPEGGRKATFRTLSDLDIFPLRVSRVDLRSFSIQGYRLGISFETTFSRSDEIGKLPLYINYLNDYPASLRFLSLLKKHLKRAFVVYDFEDNERSDGLSVPLTFGLESTCAEDETMHPVEKERTFFHFPQKELFLNACIPFPGRNWKNFTVFIDLDGDWPSNTVVNEKMFQLFATPVSNLTSSMANPVVCDGLSWRKKINHPDRDGEFSFHSIKGVYRVEDGVMIPLRPCVIAGSESTYEVETEKNEDGTICGWLDLHYPGAFEQNFNVAVDARWLQPAFSNFLNNRCLVKTWRRTVKGVKWELISSIVAHRNVDFEEKLSLFLHLFTLRNKVKLDIDDIQDLLTILGSVFSGPFRRMSDLIDTVDIQEVPLGVRNHRGMVKQVYKFGLKRYEPILECIVDTFVQHISVILNSWIDGALVDIEINRNTELDDNSETVL
jgi:type VI secretion system protein ImpG